VVAAKQAAAKQAAAKEAVAKEAVAEEAVAEEADAEEADAEVVVAKPAQPLVHQPTYPETCPEMLLVALAWLILVIVCRL